MIRALALLAGLALAGCAVQPARAEEGLPPNCAPSKTVLAYLEEKFGETPESIGVESDQTAISVFVSKAGTWTLVRLHRSGVSCILAAGANWSGADKGRGS